MFVDGSPAQPPGVVSSTFHILVWCFAIAAIFGNVLVLLWRCARKESRLQLLSLLIVSLAVADILWSCHYLIQEVMLLPALYAGKNDTFDFTSRDEALCLTVTFLSFTSCSAVMTTAVGIALHTLLHLVAHRGKIIVYIVVLISWMFCLALGTWMTLQMNDAVQHFNRSMSASTFSLMATFGCMGGKNPISFSIIVTSINAVASVACIVIYSLLCYRLRKFNANVATTELKNLQIRLTVIVVVNVIVWWPACIIYWYSYVRDESVFDGTLSLDAPLPIMMLTVVVSLINPLIYTIASKRVSNVIKNVCVLICCHGNSERQRLIVIDEDENESRCGCSVVCQMICQVRGRHEFGKGTQSIGNTTDQTTSSHLFSEIDSFQNEMDQVPSESV
ncbi:uncharacterized protein LOC134185784 [Corticium candelabrum]|uniref:uncharacterized protein LOC134185784 n=1 Tax=Corticium candelabrum TaxID=121492 RepID=UPI002E25D8DA|nr:uncharacterized protein LOC134185784 [Corticium candelabrum]